QPANAVGVETDVGQHDHRGVHRQTLLRPVGQVVAPTGCGPVLTASREAVTAPAGRSLMRWLITWVMPSPRIETPYRASADSMVHFWWVITINCEESRSSVIRPTSRVRLTSSRAASTSSMM